MKTLSLLLILCLQTISLLADEIYPPHIKQEAIDFYEKALKLKSNKQFKEARLLFDKAIAINNDFELARLQRGREKDDDYLVKAKSVLSSIPYYSKGSRLIKNGKTKEGYHTLLMGAKIDNTGIIKVKITKDRKPFSALWENILLSVENVKSSTTHLKLGYVVTKDTLYAYGFGDIDKNPDGKVTISYGKLDLSSNTIAVNFKQFTAGKAYDKEQLRIESDPKFKLINESFSQVRIEGVKDHSGVAIKINDPYGKNKGFEYKTLTDKKGFFKVKNLPNGALYLRVSKPGYIAYDFEIKVNNHEFIVDKRHMHNILFFPATDANSATLDEVMIPLYKIDKYKITYTVQKQKNVTSFKGENVITGERSISVGAMSDWARGYYHKTGSAVTFLNKNYKGSEIDFVFFRKKEGAFISRFDPQRKDNLTIAVVDKPYESINEVSPEIIFKPEAPVLLGKSYIAKLNQPDGDYFVKFTLSKK